MYLTSSTALAFILITITTIFIFYRASRKNSKTLYVIFVYLFIQGILAYFGFYNTEPINPLKIPLVVAPSFILMFYILFSGSGKKFVQSLDLKVLTLLHTIRIPVEFVLFLLFVQGEIPEIMTFEGRNLDILAGITAPFIYYLTFIKNRIGPKGLLAWNVISLALLVNIVIHALLSLEIPIQQFGLQQPNRAILKFPYIWLPVIVVPIVFFSHCAAIRRLSEKNKKTS